MPMAIIMGLLRALSGLIELAAALLMVYFNDVATSLKINALLAIIGPSIMILVTTLGLFGISNQVSPWKMLTILLGVILIFYGLNSM
ncbi:MAG: YqhV family protein [Peptococcia bacterium]